MSSFEGGGAARGRGKIGRSKKIATRCLGNAVASGIGVGAALAVTAAAAQANGTMYAHNCLPLGNQQGPRTDGVTRHLYFSYLFNSGVAEDACTNPTYDGYACIQQEYEPSYGAWYYNPRTCARTSGATVTSAQEYQYEANVPGWPTYTDDEYDTIFLPESVGNHHSHYLNAFSGWGP